MKLMKSHINRLLAGVVAVAVAAGCGGKVGVGKPGKGVDLKYRMNHGGVLKYRSVSSSTQNMKDQAMEMKVQGDKRLVFSVRPEAREDENCKLAITVDSLEVSVASRQGDFSADASNLVGKSFEMILTPTGDELEISGAESLEYDMGMAGKRSVLADLQSIFPDVAGRPVEIGGTWTSHDTLRTPEGGGELVIMIESVDTLEGFETVDGMECARISAVITGTLTGEGEQGGAKMTFDGTFSGNSLWHFAYKEGVVVSSTSEATTENTITMTGPQEMVIPVTQTKKIDLMLIGRDRAAK